MAEPELAPPVVIAVPPYETTGTVQRPARPAGGWLPTSDLRWSGTVLEQQWMLAHHDVSEIEFQWIAVPQST